MTGRNAYGSGIQIPDLAIEVRTSPAISDWYRPPDICFVLAPARHSKTAAMSRLNLFARLRYPWTSLV
jgi:hypothetical protein